MTENLPPIALIEAIEVYSNKYVTVFDDKVQFLRTRSSGSYLRIESAMPGRGVVVYPRCGDRVGLVRTYRYPIGEFQWGLPRGFSHGASSKQTASAECEEELGARPVQVAYLGTVTPDSGILSTRVDVLEAVFEAVTEETRDPDEVAEVRWLSVSELWEMIRSGEITDAFTLSAAALAHARGASM